MTLGISALVEMCSWPFKKSCPKCSLAVFTQGNSIFEFPMSHLVAFKVEQRNLVKVQTEFEKFYRDRRP
jgi:hypothetical protein